MHTTQGSAAICTGVFALSTADIGTFAAQCLTRMRADGDALLAQARAHEGQERAYRLATCIDALLHQIRTVDVLAMLAARHGDSITAEAICADFEASCRRVIIQANEARMLSLARVEQ